MNIILQHLLSGQCDEGWTAYKDLEAPTEADMRWAAALMFQRRDYMGARDLLLYLVGRGYLPARIDLATAYRYLGQMRQASEQLNHLNPVSLDANDRVLFFRELGANYFTEGHLQAASSALENAWEAAFEPSAHPSLRAGVAHLLALVLHSQGFSKAASEYLVSGGTYAQSNSRKAYLHSTSGLINTYLANFTEAKLQFELARSISQETSSIRAVLAYNRGLLARLTETRETALNVLRESVVLAEESNEIETACYALLAKCSIYTASNQFELARAVLERARVLVVADRVGLLVDLREGALLVAQGRYGGLRLLLRATRGFKGSGLRRETGWGYLRLAYASLLLGRPKSIDAYLTRATDVANALGTAAPFFAEMNEMPGLLDHLAGLKVDAYAKTIYQEYVVKYSNGPRKLSIQSLPAERLLVDGEPLRVGYRYASRILIYLLIHGPVSVERLATDVLSSMPYTRARNYFHQVRFRLRSLFPGLSITHLGNQEYGVESQDLIVELDYLRVHNLAGQDLDSLEKALSLYRGAFLAEVDEDWVLYAREELIARLLHFGLKMLSTPAFRSSPRALRMAWRLLAIEPSSVELGYMIIELCRLCLGEEHVDGVRNRLARHYARVLDEVPPGFL